MSSFRQGDLFRNKDDAGERETPTYRPDPDKVRRRLLKILAEARAAQKLPWEPTTVSLYRETVWPYLYASLSRYPDRARHGVLPPRLSLVHAASPARA